MYPAGFGAVAPHFSPNNGPALLRMVLPSADELLRGQGGSAGLGHGRFVFRPRTGRINWRTLHSLDLDRVIREGDVDTIQAHMDNVAFSRLTVEDISAASDDSIVKVMQLAQLSMEFLSSMCASSQQLLNGLMEKIRTQAANIKALEARCAQRPRRETPMRSGRRRSNSRDFGPGRHADPASRKCLYCPKRFSADQYLHEHLVRRHAEALRGESAPTQPAPAPAPAQPPPYEHVAAAAAAEVSQVLERQTLGLREQLGSVERGVTEAIVGMQRDVSRVRDDLHRVAGDVVRLQQTGPPASPPPQPIIMQSPASPPPTINAAEIAAEAAHRVEQRLASDSEAMEKRLATHMSGLMDARDEKLLSRFESLAQATQAAAAAREAAAAPAAPQPVAPPEPVPVASPPPAAVEDAASSQIAAMVSSMQAQFEEQFRQLQDSVSAQQQAIALKVQEATAAADSVREVLAQQPPAAGPSTPKPATVARLFRQHTWSGGASPERRRSSPETPSPKDKSKKSKKKEKEPPEKSPTIKEEASEESPMPEKAPRDKKGLRRSGSARKKAKQPVSDIDSEEEARREEDEESEAEKEKPPPKLSWFARRRQASLERMEAQKKAKEQEAEKQTRSAKLAKQALGGALLSFVSRCRREPPPTGGPAPPAAGVHQPLPLESRRGSSGESGDGAFVRGLVSSAASSSDHAGDALPPPPPDAGPQPSVLQRAASGATVKSFRSSEDLSSIPALGGTGTLSDGKARSSAESDEGGVVGGWGGPPAAGRGVGGWDATSPGPPPPPTATTVEAPSSMGDSGQVQPFGALSDNSDTQEESVGLAPGPGPTVGIQGGPPPPGPISDDLMEESL